MSSAETGIIKNRDGPYERRNPPRSGGKGLKMALTICLKVSQSFPGLSLGNSLKIGKIFFFTAL